MGSPSPRRKPCRARPSLMTDFLSRLPSALAHDLRRALLALGMLMCAACVSLPTASQGAGPMRQVTPLVSGWRFYDGAEPIEAAAVSFDDSTWQSVSLPHSWNRLGEYALHRTDKTRNRQGEGWYRLTLNGRSLPRSSRHFLEFDGVGNIADVWVNGAHVTHHAGAFSRFRIDVSKELRLDAPNVIAVRADNSRPAPGSTTQDVIPLQGDFFIHGGLYRPVSLISVGTAHVDLLDHGGPGVYVRTASVAGGKASIEITTRLDTAKAKHLRLRTRIEDAGRTVAEIEAPAKADVIRQSISIEHPHLWDGRRDPHLYEAVVELLDGNNVVDRVREHFGIRTVRFDAEQGFFLNGRHLSLHGVSRHQDYLGRGWALSPADHQRDMGIIEELGANTIRMAHYQHAKDWFDLSDTAGMIVWAEVPFVNKLAFTDAHATPQLVANAREQLLELIRQNYNHPSVVTWSIGNETDIDVASGRLGPKADPRPLLDELHQLARTEDPDRPTTIADCCENTPRSVQSAGLPVLAGHSELMGYNRYFGWYYGNTADFGPHLDLLHARHPTIPISVSEYGAGAALSQHSDNPEGGPITSGGRPHPEEFQSWYHEQSWPQLKARPYLFAAWIWNMFDFSSTVRNEGDATDINDKGLVSFDRKIRKDAFYYYQAQWRDDVPVLHITGRRYVKRAYPVLDVRIYSNLKSVSLFLNGRQAGTANCAEGICVLKDLRLQPGANHLEARSLFNDAAVSDAVDWTAPDAAQGLTIKVGDLAGFEGTDGRLVGSDNWFSGGVAARLSSKDVDGMSGGGDRRFWTARRTGAFRYAIPVPNGKWRVTLLLLTLKDDKPEPFTVSAEGQKALEVRALPQNSAAERSFDVTVRDGSLELKFGPKASLSAIAVRPR